MNDHSIDVQGLTKKFGGFTAVDAISFQVRRGEIFGFLGANGAGKSTTIRMLCGLLEPTSGTALVGGFDINSHTEEVKQRIGYMSQKFSLYEDLTVEENLDFFSGDNSYKFHISPVGEERVMFNERADSVDLAFIEISDKY